MFFYINTTIIDIKKYIDFLPMKSLKYFLLLLYIFLILPSLCTPRDILPFSIKEQFSRGKKGDFIVTLDSGIYTLLAIANNPSEEKGNKNISLLEISVPQNTLDFKTISWKAWVEKGAPKSISYNIYDIDLASGKLLRSFSITKNCFFTSNEQEFFITKLLNLQLKSLKDDQRKKIGPAPLDDTLDTRALWNPPLIIDGKRQKKPLFKVYQATWPKDGSVLAGKVIDLYFDAENTIPFPYWIQISNGNVDVMLKVVDSGKNINFEKHRP